MATAAATSAETTCSANADSTTTTPPTRSTADDISGSSNSNSSTSTPQRRQRMASLKKGCQRVTGGQGESRRLLFARSKSLSENSPVWSCRDSSAEGRDGQSHLCRVRSFKSTRKGLVRNGESFKSVDTTTFMSAGSVRVYRKSNLIGRSESVESSDSSVGGSSVAESYYRVGVLGAAGVGRSTLIKQFLAFDEQAESNNSNDDTSPHVTVSVLLDGEESLLEFLDRSEGSRRGVRSNQTDTHPRTTQSAIPEDSTGGFNMSLSPCDAYTVVFALNDLDSFHHGGLSLRHLREELGTDRAIILVGNKSDLVRQRRVSIKDACVLADKYNCKYIETSAELGHQTDELLVGMLRQIRLKLSTSQEETFCDVDKMTIKKHHKWQRVMHLCHILNGPASSVDSCQDLFRI